MFLRYPSQTLLCWGVALAFCSLNGKLQGISLPSVQKEKNEAIKLLVLLVNFFLSGLWKIK